MFCPKCGTQIPDEANFCWKCGLPQKDDIVAEEPKYETCEICFQQIRRAHFFAGSLFIFKAVAIGPTGTYVVAKTPELPGMDDGGPWQFEYNEKEWARDHDEFNILVEALAKDGWEFVGTYGEYYWKKRFRRRIGLLPDRKG